MITKIVMMIEARTDDDARSLGSDIQSETFETLDPDAFARVEEMGHELRTRLERHMRATAKRAKLGGV